MRRYYCGSIVVVLLTVAICAPIQAGIKDRPYSLHLTFGGVQPALNDSAQVWLFTPIIGVDLQYMLSPQTGLVLSGRRSNIENDSISTSIFKYTQGRSNRKWQITSLSLGPKFYVNRRRGITPYIESKIDFNFWKVVALPGDQAIRVQDGSGGLTQYKATEIGVTIGFGFEQLWAERVGFSVGTDFSYLSGVGADFAQSVNNSRSRALLQFNASISLHFGPQAKSLEDKYKDEKKPEPTKQDRRVYEGVIDKDTGDTTFVDKSRVDTNKTFVPISTGDKISDEDSDHDGVKDKFDKCPDTPEGALVDMDGCPHDGDGDGVLDGIDKCPDTPKEARGYIDKFGCPLDSDFDGVPDYRDKCPDSSPNVRVDSVGCPLDSDLDGVDDVMDLCPGTPRGIPVDLRGCPEKEKLFYKRVLYSLFWPGETKLVEPQNSSLDSIAILMEMFKDVTATVSGYTDDLGPADANQKVSLKRAEAIMQYLLKKGLSAERVKAVGQGETNFISSNRTKTGREKNRRIEIEFKYSSN